MPATGKVSLVRQTIYCFIPIMDIYAAYHIKKLRWYLLIMLGVGIAIGTIMNVAIPIDNMDENKILLGNGDMDWGYVFFGDDPETAIASFVITQGVVLAIAVYLIRRWSKKWNMQYDD